MQKGFLHYDKYFQNIFIELIPYYELSVAIHSLSGRKTARPFFLCFAYGNSWIKTIKQNSPSRVRALQDRCTKQNNMVSDNPHLS